MGDFNPSIQELSSAFCSHSLSRVTQSSLPTGFGGLFLVVAGWILIHEKNQEETVLQMMKDCYLEWNIWLIIENLVWRALFKDHLVQTPCSEQGHF